MPAVDLADLHVVLRDGGRCVAGTGVASGIEPRRPGRCPGIARPVGPAPEGEGLFSRALVLDEQMPDAPRSDKEFED